MSVSGVGDGGGGVDVNGFVDYCGGGGGGLGHCGGDGGGFCVFRGCQWLLLCLCL